MSLKIASLWAELGVKDTLTPALKNAKSGMVDVKGGAGDLAKALLGPAMGYATLAGAITGYIALEKQSLALAAEEETSFVRLDATIKSMGLSSELSSQGIRTLGEALMKTTNFAHEDLEAAANAFMRMDSFDPSNLKQMLQVTADFAAGTGQDAASAAQAIATALETGQTRSLHFSAALRTQVTELVKAGDSAGAYSLIMGELNKKFSGQAVAQMDTYTGSQKKLTNAWEENRAAAGEFLIGPGKSLNSWAAEAIDKSTQLNLIENQVKAAYMGLKSPAAIHAMALQQQANITKINADETGAYAAELQKAALWQLEHADAVKADSAAMIDMAAEYQYASSASKALLQSSTDLTKAQQDLRDTVSANQWDVKGIEAARARVDELKKAQWDQHLQRVLGLMEEKALQDGVIIPAEQAALTKFQIDTGMMNASWAALIESEKTYAENLMALNGLNVQTYVTTNYLQNGNYSGVGGPSQHTTPKSGTGMYTDTHPPKWIPPVYWYGQGGSFFASSPQLIGVGDRPEQVTITPAGKSTSAGNVINFNEGAQLIIQPAPGQSIDNAITEFMRTQVVR